MKVSSTLKQFLLIYDRKEDKLLKQEVFGTDTDEAVIAYRAAELYYREQPWMDIVLIGSDSIETVQKTHSTYFPDALTRLVQSMKNLDSFLAKSQVQDS